MTALFSKPKAPPPPPRVADPVAIPTTGMATSDFAKKRSLRRGGFSKSFVLTGNLEPNKADKQTTLG